MPRPTATASRGLYPPTSAAPPAAPVPAPASSGAGSDRRCRRTRACSAWRRALLAAARCRRASLSCAANSGVDTYLRAAPRRDRAPSPRPCLRPGAAQPARSARRTRTQHGLIGLPRHASAAACERRGTAACGTHTRRESASRASRRQLRPTWGCRTLHASPRCMQLV